MARLHHTLVKVALAADIDDNDTTITFESPLREFGEDNIATIGGGNILVLRCAYEIMHVTAYTSGASSATVLRGQEGSTATAHNDGDILRHVLTDQDIPDLSGYAPLASPTFTGLPVAPQWKATGVTGANTTPLTLSGANASGAPASGAHVKGEIAGDDTGKLWYCTVAGTPGTWVDVSGGGGGGGGDIATDTIWNVAGDTVYGTGSDAATRLAIGTAGYFYRVNAGATAPEWVNAAALFPPLDLQAVLASAQVTPANHAPNNTSFEQWGTEEAVIAQADAPASAVVVGWLSGGISGNSSPAAGDRGAAKLEVSFNGGSTFADLSNIGTATLYTGSGSDDEQLTATGRLAGTVTGDIQVRAMCRDVSNANRVIFSNGRINILVHPQ